MKVFIGLRDIAGYYSRLQKGFEELGIDADLVFINQHSFKYESKTVENIFVKFARKCVFFNRNIPKNKTFYKIIGNIVSFIGRLHLFIYCLIKYDVFIFVADSTFLSYKELPILKLFGKKIIYKSHGSDTRPAYISGTHYRTLFGKGGVVDIDLLYHAAKKQKKMIDIYSKYTDYIVDTYSHAQFQKKPYISGYEFGNIFDVTTKFKNIDHKPYLTILHCPSNESSKGSDKIEEIVNQLKLNYKLTYVKISNKPFIEVVKAIQEADIIIDQMYNDAPASGFAIEAASFGKPVVIGSYSYKHVIKEISKDMLPPWIVCHPLKVKDNVEKLIKDAQLREEIGILSMNFVKNNCSPKTVALKHLQLINGNIEKSWLKNPYEIDKSFASFSNEKIVKQTLKRYIEKFGQEALFLDDKPKLKQHIIGYAFEKEKL